MPKLRTLLILLAIFLSASVTINAQQAPLYFCAKGTLMAPAGTNIPEAERQKCRDEQKTITEKEVKLIHTSIDLTLLAGGTSPAQKEATSKSIASICALRYYYRADGTDEPACAKYPPNADILKDKAEICTMLQTYEAKPVYCERLMPVTTAAKPSSTAPAKK